MAETQVISFVLNKKPTQLEAHPLSRLLDVLREQALLTGTKEGCGEGECGACSIFVDGKLVNSCLIPVGQIEGKTVETIEGLCSKENLHEIQKAYLKCGGAQCGICTPGMIMASLNLLREKTRPATHETKEALAGNLCRCTGYTKIFDSVYEACKKMKARKK